MRKVMIEHKGVQIWVDDNVASIKGRSFSAKRDNDLTEVVVNGVVGARTKSIPVSVYVTHNGNVEVYLHLSATPVILFDAESEDTIGSFEHED